MLWRDIRKLNPIIDQVMGYPENVFVHAFSSQFYHLIFRSLLLAWLIAPCNPVIIVRAQNLSEEF